MQPNQTSATVHHERLWPGALGWSFVVGFSAVVGLSVVPVQATIGLGVGAATLVVAVAAAVVSSPAVTVEDGTLRAGRAHIPVEHLGDARVLDRQGVRAALGPGSDARTYACLRAWIKGAVVVEVLDPQDPTPSWLVSSRRPQALASALRAARPQDGHAAHSEQIG
ncbi:DUF3093 domain-containing protein [Cellulomonas bogoriensis]|uniref:DUF3093 domain-containing protein n=1 Tax=Cellulomonas bogoriensis 69B4 = DSM 16987 TaxID=1386082 RepID=A0A0A0C282_9CELL|nr:DUF3093 domain-containing protein [Cellulomonas bogoriensis]KGM14281.1 hypothetical protein N869_00120 [Cellulomonas bogoriensis 69B4 = DSM 16987]